MTDRRIPSADWERFAVYENPDGSHHIVVVAGNGGWIFADAFNYRDEAEWACALFNAAIGYHD